MAAEIWFISDTHFFHNNILKFTGFDGKLIRPGFRDVEHMNCVMQDNWNSLVRQNDHVYHLGDVTMHYGAAFENLMRSLNGKKRLILGNHDELKGNRLSQFFEKITMWRIFKEHNFICSHVPLREDNMRMVEFNLHGHIHQNVIDERPYINNCVEVNDFKPRHLDEIKEIIKSRS